MAWNIKFFKNERGDEIVKSFIKKLQKSTIAKVVKHIDFLQTKGPLLPMPYSQNIFIVRYMSLEFEENRKYVYFTHIVKKQFIYFMGFKKSLKPYLRKN